MGIQYPLIYPPAPPRCFLAPVLRPGVSRGLYARLFGYVRNGTYPFLVTEETSRISIEDQIPSQKRRRATETIAY